MKKLSEHQISYYTQFYEKIDAHHENSISKRSFVEKVNQFFKIDEELSGIIFDILDFDASNTLEIKEFLHFFYILQNTPFNTDDEVYFIAADIDQQNSINLEQYKRIIKSLRLVAPIEVINSSFIQFEEKGFIQREQFEQALKIVKQQ